MNPYQVLDTIYNNCCRDYSDIHEHVPTLRKYASLSKTIAEFGVRGGVSTIGILKGLLENNSNEKMYIGVDIDNCHQVQATNNLCNQIGINYSFLQQDSAKVVIPEVDMLFIDTWHIYGHLKRELENNHSKVKKYILMHDTTVDEWQGESIRCACNIEQQTKDSGYPVEEITKGLWPAIEEFLQAHPEWIMKERYTNNNGLTILERI
jgi:hypothetical protein